MQIRYLIQYSVLVIISLLLTACASSVQYLDEPLHYPLTRAKISVPYLSLAFPTSKPKELALQLALVKYKNQVAQQERWLLRHHIPYRWLAVEWQGQQLYLLAAGPFSVGAELSAKRKYLQQGLGLELAMPAVVSHSPEDMQALAGALALQSANPDAEANVQSSFSPSEFSPSR